MDVLRPQDAPDFLRVAGPLLARDEARNQLPLGIAGTIVRDPNAYDVVRYWVVRDAERPVAAALRTEPFNLLLGDPASPAALGTLLEAVLRDDPDVPGVLGNEPWVRTAARELAGATGRTERVILSQGAYALTAVADVARAPGEPRAAGEADRDLLTTWLSAFSYESVPDPEDHVERIRRSLDARLTSEDEGYWLWQDGGVPVSLAGYWGPTPTGIRVGPVYTPPEARRRGYATTLVADLSRWLLGRGRRACFLYTDLTNPTSNRIYTQIGYEWVCENTVFRFDRA